QQIALPSVGEPVAIARGDDEGAGDVPALPENRGRDERGGPERMDASEAVERPATGPVGAQADGTRDVPSRPPGRAFGVQQESPEWMQPAPAIEDRATP